ncbi:MAG: triose-phosphate isomerase [Candidatus Marinimicrobia bacterium]|nr:triose-phosphate isomerase [Candidatus Neomarinimicrobiota bacterium]|tara:strand:+ start:295 stop:1059 length:765 start_codon:yes stop_codon:yes gene_type:complete
MNKKYCVANWKMNQSLEDCDIFIDKLNSELIHNGVEMIICPSFVHLTQMQKSLNDLQIKLGAQTISEYSNGAYTGETSAEMLNDLNINWTIIGHSERRQLFDETNDDINNKLKVSISKKINPILCIGETLTERKNRKTLEVLKRQIQVACDSIDFSNVEFVIAYEPVWAIGTGEAADLETISETHEQIRSILPELIASSNHISILYGGSVNPGNCKNIINIDNVDGFLIGGASLDPQKFLSIYTQMNEIGVESI